MYPCAYAVYVFFVSGTSLYFQYSSYSGQVARKDSIQCHNYIQKYLHPFIPCTLGFKETKNLNLKGRKCKLLNTYYELNEH